MTEPEESNRIKFEYDLSDAFGMPQVIQLVIAVQPKQMLYSSQRSSTRLAQNLKSVPIK